MNTKMVVSNIRVPYEEWAKIRILAAEMGMSINEYIRFAVNEISITYELVPPSQRKKGDFPIWKVYELASKKGKGKGLSKGDKIIYQDA